MSNTYIQISVSDLAHINGVELPTRLVTGLNSGVYATWVSRPAGRVRCEVIDHRLREGQIRSIDLRLEDQTLLRIAAGNTVAPDNYAVLEAADLEVDDGIIVPTGGTKWRLHFPLERNLDQRLRAVIKESWTNALGLKSNTIEDDGTGLRLPQIGALHAVAAHWSIKRSPALVVMPTGTGKTDTMIAAMVMRAPRRTLVLVPSDILRTQLTEKFKTLGVLRSAGVLSDGTLNPIVGVLTKGSALVDGAEGCRPCNVVISTVAMLDEVSDEHLVSFLELFEVVFVDEVHHAPARSWKKILDRTADRSLVGFSATPFREDAKRIPGTVVYNFPLRRAQELGYFNRIELCLIDEPDMQRADVVIAERAVAALLEDEKRGFDHVILARTSTQKHAEKLLEEVYKPRFSSLNPVVLHSSISGKKEIIEGIRAGIHRIVICVDMFGEGFDMPSLKIAALHAIHKSLAITLQFTGRFTRSARNVGNATVVANIANAKLSRAIDELYSESADWQELLPRLSETAIGNELQADEFGSTIRLRDLPEANLFDLQSLRPALSAVFFRATSFNAEHVSSSLPKQCNLHAQWISEAGDVVICVTRSKRPITWASAREATDEVWELWLLAYNRKRKLLYLSVSSRSSSHIDFAKRVTNGSALIVSGELMFRALAKMRRLELYNVGLYGKGKLRYRMFAGRDLAEQITLANQNNNSKSNLFGSGYERGERTSIGVSHKGMAWSMEVASVPVWREWCDRVSKKIMDDKINTNEFLKHTLNPKSVTELPKRDILAVMVPDAWTIGIAKPPMFAARTNQLESCSDLYISDFEIRGSSLVVTLSHDQHQVVALQLMWGPASEEQRFSVIRGISQLFVDGVATTWSDYLTEHPFSILFVDGSELQGGVHLQRIDGQELLFDVTHAKPVSWETTPLKKESKWKDGVLRSNSIQGFWIDELLKGSGKIVFDDDDANEAADIVEIDYDERDIVCRLYHCKYSAATTPGLRVSDVQEVCAQAARSAKWADSPEALFQHLQLRESSQRLGGRTTRFERGDMRALSLSKRLLSRRHFRLQIYVVQPGLAISQLDRNVSAVLGACDNFVQELTGYALTVITSA